MWSGTGTSRAQSCCDAEGWPPLVIREVLIEWNWAQDYASTHTGTLDTVALSLEIFQTPRSLDRLWVPWPTWCVAWGPLRSILFLYEAVKAVKWQSSYLLFTWSDTLFPSSFRLGTAGLCGLSGTFICRPVYSGACYNLHPNNTRMFSLKLVTLGFGREGGQPMGMKGGPRLWFLAHCFSPFLLLFLNVRVRTLSLIKSPGHSRHNQWSPVSHRHLTTPSGSSASSWFTFTETTTRTLTNSVGEWGRRLLALF